MPARFSRRTSHRLWWLLGLALLVAVRWAFEQVAPDPTGALDEGLHPVKRVVDGDTLLLRSGERVRLQGIDTPETVRPNYPVEPWGPEASQFTEQFVEDADGEVRLTFGPERLDDYGRTLAFVWHGEQLLNEELVRAGLARARLGYRYSGTMKRRLAAAQDEARAARRGIWSNEIPSAASN